MTREIGGVELTGGLTACMSVGIVMGLLVLWIAASSGDWRLVLVGLLPFAVIGAVYLDAKRQKRRLERRRRERQARQEKLKESLKGEGHWKHVRKFIEKYSAEQRGRPYEQLGELLERKGHDLEEYDLTWILEEAKAEREEEKREREYREFRQKLKKRRPDTAEEYVEALLDSYGANWEDHLSRFVRLLQDDKGLDIPRGKVRGHIEEAIKERKLEAFEEQLLEDEPGMADSRRVDLDRVSGYEFEGLLAELFEQMGYEVEETPLSGDQGGDLVLTQLGTTVVVQAKAYDSGNNVGNEAVREAHTARSHYGADEAWVVTTSGFTSAARELAESTGVELVDREKLEDWIEAVPY